MRTRISEISKSIKKGELALFCGAGISRNSGLPLADELKGYVLKDLLIDEKDINEIMNFPLPFEVFMETILENTDISRILDIFEDGKPNTNHLLFARLAKNGYLRTIFTTNFDLLLEKALEEEGLRRDRHFKVYYNEKQFSEIDSKEISDKMIKIIKIHGSIDDRSSIRMVLDTVASKVLSDKRMKVVENLFSTGNHKKVLILGYSCSDEFDITPQIRSIDRNHKLIILVDHSEEERVEDIRTRDSRNPFKNFHGIRLICNTDKLIEELWNSLREIIGEKYVPIHEYTGYRTEWRRYIHDWSKRLEKDKKHAKYSIVASIFLDITNFKKSIEYFERSIEIAELMGDRIAQSMSIGNLGRVYAISGTFKNAIECHRKSLKIAKKIGYETGEMKSYTNLGGVYHSLGDLETAIEYCKKALEVAIRIGDKIEESASYGNLGHICSDLGDFRKAIDYYDRSLRMHQVLGNKMDESSSYIGLGNVYSRLTYFERALECYAKALKIALQIGNRVQEGVIYENLGTTYLMKGDFELGTENYLRSLEINREIENKQGESSCYLGLGNIYFCLHDFEKAVEYYEKSLSIAEQIGNEKGKSLGYIGLGNVYSGLGDFETAREYYLKAER